MTKMRANASAKSSSLPTTALIQTSCNFCTKVFKPFGAAVNRKLMKR